MLVDSTLLSDGIGVYYGLVKHEKQISGTGEAEVLNLTLTNDGKTINTEGSTVNHNTELTMLLHLRIDASVIGSNLVIVIRNASEMPICTYPIYNCEGELASYSGGVHLIEITLGTIELNTGMYSFVVSLSDLSSGVVLMRVQGLHPFRVLSPHNYWSPGVAPRVSRILSISD